MDAVWARTLWDKTWVAPDAAFWRSDPLSL